MEDNENFIHNKYGYCYYSIGDAAIVFGLYVNPEYRRQGHARKLVQYVMNEIRTAGHIGDILVEADPKESSVDVETLKTFYLSLGLRLYTQAEENTQQT